MSGVGRRETPIGEWCNYTEVELVGHDVDAVVVSGHALWTEEGEIRIEDNTIWANREGMNNPSSNKCVSRHGVFM